MGKSNQNIFDRSSKSLETAFDKYDKGTEYTIPEDLSRLQNPYTENVMRRIADDLERQREIQQNRLGYEASQAGAFGGSRHGLMETVNTENFNRQLGDISARMRMAAYDNALKSAQQEYVNQQNAAGNLANLGKYGYQLGGQVQQSLWNAAEQKRQMQQQLANQAKAQFDQWRQAPIDFVELMQQTIQASPYSQSTTNSQSPGLFDYLTLGATTAASMYPSG